MPMSGELGAIMDAGAHHAASFMDGALKPLGRGWAVRCHRPLSFEGPKSPLT